MSQSSNSSTTEFTDESFSSTESASTPESLGISDNATSSSCLVEAIAHPYSFDEAFLKKFQSGGFGKQNIQEHFVYEHSFLEPSKKVVLKCKHCKENEGSLKSDCSNNFERHILKKHPNKFLRPRAEKRGLCLDDWMSQDDTKKKNKKVKLTDPQQLAYKKGVVDLICSSALPFSLVESDGWKRFMYAVAPQITVQCRQTVVNDLETSVKQLKPKIKNVLSGIDKKTLHISLDLWSSRQRQSVMGIRCQFIDKSWKFHNLLLSFTHFPGKHSGEAIVQKLTEELMEVGVHQSNISCVCADNASNITRAINMVDVFAKDGVIQEEDGLFASKESHIDETDLQPSECFDMILKDDSEYATEFQGLEFENLMNDTMTWQRKCCIAHTLQLAINDAIKRDIVAKPLLTKLQDWINFFRRSPKWTEELKSKTNGRDLKQTGGVRWNSLFFALERFVQDSMVEGMLITFSKAKKEKVKINFDLPTEDDVEDAKQLVSILRPLKRATDYFQQSGLISSKVIGGLLTVFKETFEVETDKFADLQISVLTPVAQNDPGG